MLLRRKHPLAVQHPPLRSWLAGWGLLAALTLPLGACSGDEPDEETDASESEEDSVDGSNGKKSEDEETKSGGDKSEDTNASVDKDPSKDDPSQDDKNEDSNASADKDPSQDDPGSSERDCSKIEWGSSLKMGGIIPEAETKGFIDTDGDHKAEDEEQDIGMCALHKLKAKCGLVVTGWKG